MAITFDTLFPESPYKKVLTLSMQLRNAIAMLKEYQGTEEDYSILTGLICGHLVVLNSRIETVLKESKMIQRDDLEYLLALMGYLKNEVKGLVPRFPELSMQANGLVQTIQNTLEQGLEHAYVAYIKPLLKVDVLHPDYLELLVPIAQLRTSARAIA